jgi:hypothetical protein
MDANSTSTRGATLFRDAVTRACALTTFSGAGPYFPAISKLDVFLLAK